MAAMGTERIEFNPQKDLLGRMTKRPESEGKSIIPARKSSICG